MDYIVANLAVFYNGAVSFKELEFMPIPAVLNLDEYAARINTERKRELERK